jgi:integrase
MATLKQHSSGVWRVRFWYNGIQYFRSLETENERTANGLLATIEETLGLLKTGRLTIPVETEDVGAWIVSGGKQTARPVFKERHPLKDVVEEYFDSIPVGAKADNSIATERTHLNHFVRLLKGSTPIDSIGVAELQDYVALRSKEDGIRGRKVQPDTIRKELVTFGTMRRWAMARGWCGGEIDRKAIKLPKGQERAPFRTWEEIRAIIDRGGLTDVEQLDLWDCLFLSEEEVLEFLAFTKDAPQASWLHPALSLAAFTGARRSEIRRSEVQDFDFARGIVTLRERKRKHSKSLSFRLVEIHPRLATVMQEWFADHPGGKYAFYTEPNTAITPDQAEDTLEDALAGSKWSVLRGWHVLRHSFASICAMKGLRESTISKWMGHETEEMKQRYRHLFPEVTKAEMARLFL